MVDLVRAERSPEDLAKKFEPTAQSLRNWVCQADLDKGRRHDGLRTDEREELQSSSSLKVGITIPLDIQELGTSHP
jgi:transposase-like protein